MIEITRFTLLSNLLCSKLYLQASSNYKKKRVVNHWNPFHFKRQEFDGITYKLKFYPYKTYILYWF